jgi:predicted transcriptional regulator YdeE
MMMKDTYYVEPKLITMGEIKLVGMRDVFIKTSQLGVDTKEPIPNLYSHLINRAISGAIKNILNMSITTALEMRHEWPQFIKYPSMQYHLAAYEVSDFRDVPSDMTAVTLPASKYALFYCESPYDPKTKKPQQQVNWDPLYDGTYDLHKILEGHGIKKYKGFHLERSHYWHEEIPGMPNAGYPIYKFEIWMPIED